MNRSSPESAEPHHNDEPSRTRRAYKACLHCRSRKAKCDLGDIDAPSKPPCARCKRERRECVFAPSFRGGKIVKRASVQSPPGQSLSGEMDSDYKKAEGSEQGKDVLHTPSSSTKEVFPGQPSVPPFNNSDLEMDVCSPSEGPPRKTMRLDHHDDSPGRSRSGTVDVDPQSLAATSLRNPTDALNLLALAADVDRATKSKGKHGKNKRRADGRLVNERDEEDTVVDEDLDLESTPTVDDVTGVGVEVEQTGGSTNLGVRVSAHRPHPKSPSPPSLRSYELVKQGIVNPDELSHLTSLFFSRVHIIFPMMSYNRIPRTGAELARFAEEDPHLLTAIVVITSRQERMFTIHERSWNHMQNLINELILGKAGSVGAVEALLLLSENLPRRQEPASEDEEHRMSWMLVGMASKLASSSKPPLRTCSFLFSFRRQYMLGLDQKTLRPVTLGLGGDETPLTNGEDSASEREKLDREQLAWTYCYIFDRSISIRSGKAFWSRGPGLCFQRTHSGLLVSAAECFPSLRPILGKQDDFAAVLQAYTELTQTMASAHDVLYPSKDRTIALVRVGDYHKYLDEFTRSKNGFKLNWEGKVWETQLVTECVWINFHYLRLYIYAFAFQAHVQRSVSTSEDGKKVAETVIFPRGPMGSPDARFILEAIDAATDLLKICVDKLHPSNTLSYLPWRFFLYFSYAGVFLLKAVFVGAVVPQDQGNIVQLIKKVIMCLAYASSDEHHSGVRYARLLNGLLRVFSRGVDGVTSQLSTPKRSAMALPEITAMQSSDKASSSKQDVRTDPLKRPALSVTGGNGAKPIASETRSLTTPLNQSPMDILPSGSNNVASRSPASMGAQPLQHPLLPPDDVYYAHAAQSRQLPRVQTQQTQQYHPVPYSSGTNPGAPPPMSSSHHHQQHIYTSPHSHPHHHLPPQTPSQAHASSQAGGFHSGGGHSAGVHQGGYNVYQPPSSVAPPPTSAQSSTSLHNMNFQFDLNWTSMEADGLTQMLADEHSLDGDFWMSLPSHAAWQSWPAGTATTPLNLNPA
ncbi:hypothetical protein SCHPADRAFT_928922 [Schizopora paradoxa]|uniref:Zn(2)-C6 fungal-type domain-containing protein n=1 Tax=Schizopora paradoxa TaxID=27342 RepID=A0A0H2S7N4_9AGAM|nr:hypothetical protein SCHPADRAFT_928922 [Schizopora paradoxa]